MSAPVDLHRIARQFYRTDNAEYFPILALKRFDLDSFCFSSLKKEKVGEIKLTNQVQIVKCKEHNYLIVYIDTYKQIPEFLPDSSDKLYKIKDYQGVSGLTTFDENGDVIKPVAIKTVLNGKFSIVRVIDNKSNDLK